MEDWKVWLSEAKKKKQSNNWDFNEFKIICKCKSFNTEIFGEGESESGYYNESYFKGNILIKCHSCGNAMVIPLDSYTDFNTINKGDFDE